jgi:ribonuclease HII
MILGIDEVGRGPWAGPLVVGAVVLGGHVPEGIDDSKKLSKKRREALAGAIYETAQAVGLGWVSANELDQLGMSEALREATRRAVRAIHTPYHEIIIDGTVNFLSGTPLEKYVTVSPKADSLFPSVSAASIVAKVARDRYMTEQDALYPNYGFAAHAGYGVARHRHAIEAYGVTPLHRLSFAPLKKFQAEKPVEGSVTKPTTPLAKNSRVIGNESEEAAAQELVQRGHELLERNWRTKWCEIDIVSQRKGILYFTEVKHRKTDTAGGGIAAITPKKQRQMEFAARLYAASFGDADLRLVVIVTTNEPPLVIEYLELS